MTKINELMRVNAHSIKDAENMKKLLERSHQNLIWISENTIEEISDSNYFLVYKKQKILLVVSVESVKRNSYIMFLSVNGRVVSDICIFDRMTLEEAKQILLEKAEFLYDVVTILDLKGKISLDFVDSKLMAHTRGTQHYISGKDDYDIIIDDNFNLTIKPQHKNLEMIKKANSLKEKHSSVLVEILPDLSYYSYHTRAGNSRLEVLLKTYI